MMAASVANAKKTDDEGSLKSMWHCDHCDMADNAADKNFCWDCGVARPGTDGPPETMPVIDGEEIATSDLMMQEQFSAAIRQPFAFIRCVDGVMTSTHVDPKTDDAPAAAKRARKPAVKPVGQKRGRKEKTAK